MEAARSTKVSTASVCRPMSAAQAGPGASGGLGGELRCRITFVMLGPHCPPRSAAWSGLRSGPVRRPGLLGRPGRRRTVVGC
eukprot:1670566-Pyramimonas_sp.AAC.1